LLDRLTPPSRPWHPMYLPYRAAARALREAHAGRPGDILFVGHPQSQLARLVREFPGQHHGASAARLTEPGWDRAVAGPGKFQTAVVELTRADLIDARGIYEAVARLVGENGKVILSWINDADTAPNALVEEGLAGLLLLPTGAASQAVFTFRRSPRPALRLDRRQFGHSHEAARAAASV